MSDSYRILVENGLYNGLLGIVGGFARLATGLAPRDNVWAEIFRIAVIAMPIAWFSGGLASEYGSSDYLVSGISFFTGMMGHNIARVIMDLGFIEVIKLLLGRR